MSNGSKSPLSNGLRVHLLPTVLSTLVIVTMVIGGNLWVLNQAHTMFQTHVTAPHPQVPEMIARHEEQMRSLFESKESANLKHQMIMSKLNMIEKELETLTRKANRKQ